jgi:hypothetical protein
VEAAAYYGAAQVVMSLALVFIGAKVIQAFGGTFHSRHTYTQCFVLAAYTLGPLFLVRLLDAFPAVSPWLSFGIGMLLCVMVMYQGLPRMLEPDPPHTMGLYLSSAVLLVTLGALARLLTLMVLDGKVHLR